jgi:hypothetical protein
VVIPISDTARYDPNPDGVDDITLGAEIVIQVTNIYP